MGPIEAKLSGELFAATPCGIFGDTGCVLAAWVFTITSAQFTGIASALIEGCPGPAVALVRIVTEFPPCELGGVAVIRRVRCSIGIGWNVLRRLAEILSSSGYRVVSGIASC